MALDYRATYGAQVLSGDPGYPYGKPRNVSIPGDGTGTPFEASLVGDYFGFLQSLLVAAGITPSGTPDAVGASDYLAAVTYLTRNIAGAVTVQGGVSCIGPLSGFTGAFGQFGTNIIGNSSASFGTPVGFSQPVTLDDVATFNQQVTVSLGGIVVGSGFVALGNGLAGILIQAGGINVLAGTVSVTPPATFHDEIVLADAGRIRKRIVYGTDGNSTYSITSADVVVVKSATVTAARIYTIDEGGVSLGSHVEFQNYTTFVMTIHNAAGATLCTVPVVGSTSVRPGIARLHYQNDGASIDRWLAYEVVTPP